MSTKIITSIEVLRKVVKVNSSMPWESISPYLNDARDFYLVRYLGDDLVESIEKGEEPELVPLVSRALGPLAVMLATPEMGIFIGDNGITVQNDQQKRSPASESKISAAVKSFQLRGFQAMDRLLAHLEKNADIYPLWAESSYCTIRKDGFINTAQEFQDIGFVDIDYSIITFNLLYATIRQLQDRFVRELLGEELYQQLLDKSKEPTPKEQVLTELIIRFLSNKTAAIYTSQTGREQRTRPARPEFSPVIRPLYNDLTETGNFFADQAAYYESSITKYLMENSEELGINKEITTFDWNSKDKKLFTSIS